MSLVAGVSLCLTHRIGNDDDEFGAFTNVKADIFLKQEKIGAVAATIVDRQKIPGGYFMTAMDGYSQDMQYVGCTVFEPRYGRTKLKSLAQYDNTLFGAMYIETFHIEDAYKQNGASDVGATALHQFLHHPYIKGNIPGGRWKVATAVYILDPLEAMTQEERTEFKRKRDEQYRLRWEKPEETDESRREKAEQKRRLNALARLDANQFLRNGFFQDSAIACQGEDRFLVASYGKWSREPLSHAEAAAVQFYVPPPKPPAPSGKDADILQTIIKACTKFRGSQVFSPPEAASTDQLFGELRTEITRLMSEGGSLSRSHAIHVACAKNVIQVVQFCLEMDPSTVNSLDEVSLTPLMVATIKAVGRGTIDGIDETHVIDTLLAAGANKDIQQDPFGLTAYGHFNRMMKEYEISNNAMMGLPHSTHTTLHSTEFALQQKLYPPGGPTASDLSGGEGEESGFMDYSQEDGDDGDAFENDEDYGDY